MQNTLHSRVENVEGLTRPALLAYLAPYTLPETDLRSILAMVAFGGGIDSFTLVAPRAEKQGESQKLRVLVVCGPARTIEIREGIPHEKDREIRDPLTFFVKPGHASTTTLRVERQLNTTSCSEKVLLLRDTCYRYWLNEQWVQVIGSTGDFIQLETVGVRTVEQPQVDIAATSFWPFVFGSYGSDLDFAEISADHVATLLGLNRLKTLARHIGAGHLPAVRATSRRPGIRLAGLVEFLAYRQRFPQGHSKSVAVEAWQAEWRQTHSQFVHVPPSRRCVQE